MVSMPTRYRPLSPDAIESRVLRALTDAGQSSVVMLAQRMQMTSARDFAQLRNAVYRLLAKGLVERAGVEDRDLCGRIRIVWRGKQ